MVQSRVRSPVMPRTSAAGVSRASSVPWSMMATRSLSVAASSMSWVVMTTVVPPAFSSATFSHRKSRAAGSSPVEGSSRKSTAGACMRARAIIIRWICPPEKSSGRPSGPVGQAELVEELVGQLLAPRPRHPVIAGVEEQVLADRQRAVQIVLLGDHAEYPTGADRVGDHVDAGHAGPSPGGADPGGQDPDGRGLAGTVRSEEPEDLAAPHLEADPGQRVAGSLRIALDQIGRPRRPARRRRSDRRGPPLICRSLSLSELPSAGPDVTVPGGASAMPTGAAPT